ncbi:MAG TPA: enediyne biosynthesis protein UnbU [Herpetosiphonaceae bacterium]
MATQVLEDRSTRLAGLRRFAIAITILNVIGRLILGFEPSWAHLLVAIATTYTLELLYEVLNAWRDRRPVAFRGGIRNLVDFLLSAHIAACAVSMLLYPNDRLLPIVFAAAVAISSKTLIRVAVGNGSRHILNPSNFGITITLLCFPWVSISPPYQFTENLAGLVDWLLPALIIMTGSMLNAKFTRRLPLIAAWLSGFAAQALVRNLIFGTAFQASLGPMTGVAFILFTFYMVTDPATTPSSARGQIVFGLAIATFYGLLMTLHIVFGLFFALTIVCLGRGLILYLSQQVQQFADRKVAAPSLAVATSNEQ